MDIAKLLFDYREVDEGLEAILNNIKTSEQAIKYAKYTNETNKANKLAKDNYQKNQLAKNKIDEIKKFVSEQKEKVKAIVKNSQDVDDLESAVKLSEEINELIKLLDQCERDYKNTTNDINTYDAEVRRNIQVFEACRAQAQKFENEVKKLYAQVNPEVKELNAKKELLEKDLTKELLDRYNKLKKERKSMIVYNIVDTKRCVCGISSDESSTNRIQQNIGQNGFAICSDCGRILVSIQK